MQFRPWPDTSATGREQEQLAQWKAEGLFRQTLEATRGGQPFVFFEGPPTANGRPGIHHVFSRTIKDLICRFRALQGRSVTRIAGWDTHGLPVEIEVEKELKLSGKRDIERFGVAEFNARARTSVLRYQSEWEELSDRIGYWLDCDRPYVTYSNDYVETVWWLLHRLRERDLLYRGHRVLPYCPRCGTALSSHELAQGYETVTTGSVYLTFPVAGEAGRELLVWTTTPWTLLSNVALAVNPGLEYGEYSVGDRRIILATARAASLPSSAARAPSPSSGPNGRSPAARWWESGTSGPSTRCRSPKVPWPRSLSPANSSPPATAPASCTWRPPSVRTTTPRARSTGSRWCGPSRPTARSPARAGSSSKAGW